jgi:hypothetical protein
MRAAGRRIQIEPAGSARPTEETPSLGNADFGKSTPVRQTPESAKSALADVPAIFGGLFFHRQFPALYDPGVAACLISGEIAASLSEPAAGF